MEKSDIRYQAYVSILEEELKPAMGCTEPIAIAYCAAKIAEAVDAGIIGYYMAKRGQNFDDGDGIVTAGIEATIRNVGRLAKEGMKETNDEIISIMIGS